MSGTDAGYLTTRSLKALKEKQNELGTSSPTILRTQYHMSGTDTTSSYALSTLCPVLIAYHPTQSVRHG
eukprot:6337-Rhodomonas_salina.1